MTEPQTASALAHAQAHGTPRHFRVAVDNRPNAEIREGRAWMQLYDLPSSEWVIVENPSMLREAHQATYLIADVGFSDQLYPFYVAGWHENSMILHHRTASRETVPGPQRTYTLRLEAPSPKPDWMGNHVDVPEPCPTCDWGVQWCRPDRLEPDRLVFGCYRLGCEDIRWGGHE